MKQFFGHYTNSAILHMLMSAFTSEKLATENTSIDYTHLLKYK